MRDTNLRSFLGTSDYSESKATVLPHEGDQCFDPFYVRDRRTHQLVSNIATVLSISKMIKTKYSIQNVVMLNVRETLHAFA